MLTDKTPPNFIAYLLILGGVIPLIVAFTAQFGFHLSPCHFCLLERYPYLLVIACGIGALFAPYQGLWWRLCIAFALMAWLATALLSLVHAGIEQGVLHYAGGCVAQPAADTSLEALRAQISSAPIVACNEVTVAFLGLSMATWNALAAFGLMALSFLQYRCERSRYVG